MEQDAKEEEVGDGNDPTEQTGEEKDGPSKEVAPFVVQEERHCEEMGEDEEVSSQDPACWIPRCCLLLHWNGSSIKRLSKNNSN